MAHLLRILSRRFASPILPSQPLIPKSSRGLHIPPGEREKALLEEDPALKQFKSNKETVRLVKRFGDILVIIVSIGCIYQIYDVTQIRRAERKEPVETNAPAKVS